MGNIIFTTERLIVRQYEPENDLENFYLLNSDPEVMQYIRVTKSREECEVFFRKIIVQYAKTPLIGRWAVELKTTGEFVGSFAIIPIEDTEDIQLGYALLKAYWGLGYASELTQSGLDYYFECFPVDHIYAIAEKPNIASHNVLMKNGFVKQLEKSEGQKTLYQYIFKKVI